MRATCVQFDLIVTEDVPRLSLAKRVHLQYNVSKHQVGTLVYKLIDLPRLNAFLIRNLFFNYKYLHTL